MFCTALAALWCAIGGIVALILGTGVLEVVAVELAGVVLAVIAAALLITDNRVGCGHQPDCADTRGSR